MSGFEIKTFNAITADMIARMRASTDKVTDFNVGSVVRALLEAPALELDEFYQSLYYGLLDAIPTAIYRGFGFDIQAASTASGWLTITLPAAAQAEILIAAGTVFVAYDDTRYLVGSPVTVPIGGTSATVRLIAETAGTAGNQPAGAIVGGLNMDSGLSGATLASGEITGGRDLETETERAERFATFIRALARGTLAALEYAAQQAAVLSDAGTVIERVERVAAVEEPGHVYLYIHNGSGATSAALVAAATRIIEGYRDTATQEWVGGYRPAGMRVDVVAMVDRALDVSLEIKADPALQTVATRNAIAARLSSLLRGVLSGADLRPIEIVNTVLAVDAVNGVTVLAPTSSIDVGYGETLQLGTLDITWIS